MVEDMTYCSSSYLQFRTMADDDICFSKQYPTKLWRENPSRMLVHNADDLLSALEQRITKMCSGKKAALALSGGIDSAILAKFMPPGSKAYTFKCVVPGIEVKDESVTAAQYAQECGLDHSIVEIYWEDFETYAPILMKHKGAPIHSIEVQIYKAALEALNDDIEVFVIGESSDLNYGGLSDLLSKDRTLGEFIERYNYVQPYRVLKEFEFITAPYLEYVKDGYFDTHEFCRGFFLREAMGSYSNACDCAGIALETPYVHTWLAEQLDLKKIRDGANKYIVREAFHKLYPGYVAPPKTPMPRPMDEWMSGWAGPTREEFWSHCTDRMTGDQKWMVWALEQFLEIINEGR